jgi:hypothetical protein
VGELDLWLDVRAKVAVLAKNVGDNLGQFRGSPERGRRSISADDCLTHLGCVNPRRIEATDELDITDWMQRAEVVAQSDATSHHLARVHPHVVKATQAVQVGDALADCGHR